MNGQEAGLQGESGMAQVGWVQRAHTVGRLECKPGRGGRPNRPASAHVDELSSKASIQAEASMELHYLWLACVLLAAS